MTELDTTTSASPTLADPLVSFDDEPLILVDAEDREVGFLSKLEAHAGEGVLHRAFSVFLFDREGQVLVQQRSASKPLWPLFWANSCCSHPRRGETVEGAAVRRVREELGLEAELEPLFKFEYHARFRDLGSEHEMCSVLVGRFGGKPQVNGNEIAAWRMVRPAALDTELVARPGIYTPWLKLEWPRIRREFWQRVVAR